MSHLPIAEFPDCETLSSLSKPFCKLFHEVWPKHLGNIDAGVPLFLDATDPTWL